MMIVNENPFIKMEAELGQSKYKKTMAKVLRDAEFSAAMHTGQYSEYHTEGEKVGDHYKLIFNVMNAILNDDEAKYGNKLPEEVRESLSDLDESVKATIKEYPSLLRYVVLTHDIAKTPGNRTFNIKKFKMPTEVLAGELSDSVMDAARGYAERKSDMEAKIIDLETGIKAAAQEIKALEKTIKNKKTDPEQSIEARKQLEGRQETRKNLQDQKAELEEDLAQDAAVFYDKLKELGLSGAEITKYFGLGVGFVKHEEKSAEVVREMEMPEDVKSILAKLADDHIVPLNRFADPKMDDNTAATFFDRTYGEYLPEEFRLSVAMAALDILGSLRLGEKPDLTPIKNIFKGRRESWVKVKVGELLNDEVQKALEEAPEYADLKGIDVKDKSTPVEMKQKYSKMRKEVEIKLKQRLREEYKAG